MELKDISAQVLQDLLNNLTQAKDFAITQAPDFCQQIITRGCALPLFGAAVCMALGLTTLGFSIFCFLRAARIEREGGSAYYDNWEIHFRGIGIIALIAGIGLLAASLANAYQALSVYIAPKVYLVETITHLIHGK